MSGLVAVLVAGACGDDGGGGVVVPSPDLGTKVMAEVTLDEDEYVASCIGIGDATFEPPATLCVGTTDGSVRELGHRVMPGVGPSLSADRSWIAFVDDERLVVVDATGAEVAAIDGQSDVVAVAWADESHVIVHRDNGSDRSSVEQISLGSPATANEVIASGLSGDVEAGIAVSPDGASVAYSSKVGDVWELRIVDVSTGVQRTVYSSEDFVYSPSWSPKGDELAVVEGMSIQSIDVRDGTGEVLAFTGRDVTSPTWSPNGEDVLFVDSRGALLMLATRDMATMKAVVDYSNGDFSERFPAFPQWT